MVDLMQRRAAMTADATSRPFKTVVVQEDHTKDAVGAPLYWESYLGLPEIADYDNFMYMAFFKNNTCGFYPVDLIMWIKNKNGDIVRESARADFSNWNATTGRSLYCSAGTIIELYKIPR